MERDELKWVLILLIISAIFGSTFVLMKDTLDSFGVFALLTIRFWLATLILGAFIAASGRKITHEELRCGGFLGIILFLIFAFQTWGLEHTTPSNNAFFTSLFVVFVPLLSMPLLHRAPKRKIWAAAAISLAGIYLVSGAGAGFNAGDAATVACAIGVALQVIFLSKYAKSCDPVHLTFMQLALVALLSTPLMFLLGEVPQAYPPPALATIAYLAIFASIIAQWGIAAAQRHMEASKAALVTITELLFASLFSYFLAGEAFTAQKIAGGALIVLALFIAEYDKIEI